MHKALLTGMTGFVGGHLAELLLREGWEVHGILRGSSRPDLLSESLRKRAILHVHGKGMDLTEIVGKTRPDVVFHLASLFLARHSYEDIGPLMDSNITFGTKLLEAMAQHGVRNFICAGTSWQHYEGAAYNPVNLYAASKQAFEAILRYYEESAGMRVIVLKLFDTYGPGDRRKKLLPLLEGIARSGGTLAMSPGEQKVDYVHVDDVADAFLLAARYLLEGRFDLCGSYAVSSGHAIPLRQLVERYEKILGRKLSIDWGGRPYRPREVMIPWREGRLLPGWERRHRELM